MQVRPVITASLNPQTRFLSARITGKTRVTIRKAKRGTTNLLLRSASVTVHQPRQPQRRHLAAHI
jgi:hypothetical protein